MVNQLAAVQAATVERAALFDGSGRRIPYPGMRVFGHVARRYFCLIQPDIDYGQIYERVSRAAALPFSAQRFEETAKALLAAVAAEPALGNLVKAVHAPFICPPKLGDGFNAGLPELLTAVERAYVDRYPGQDFMNLCPDKPGAEALIAPDSRYQTFDAARASGHVVGIYFADALAGYDLASQRKQMTTLPAAAGGAAIALSGAVDIAAALVGSPELLWNESNYPFHLCASAVQEPGDPLVYTFEAYGYNLRFRYRSNMLTPAVTQVSEQWTGGLTVFTVIE